MAVTDIGSLLITDGEGNVAKVAAEKPSSSHILIK
jgi:hypothetical protein